MAIISKQKIEKLIGIKEPFCASIYLPTQRTGDNEDSKIRLKNHIKSVLKELENKGMKQKEIKEFLSPIEGLLDDVKYWNHLSDGLVVYRNPDYFMYATLPVSFQNISMVRDTFYILPVMPLFQGDGQFFILSLSLKYIRFFVASRDSITKIEVKDLIPKELAEVTGRDVEQKSLQFRSGQSDRGRPMYHGKGEGKDDKKEEIIKYLQFIERGITDMLTGYQSPLVVASVDYIYAMYRDVNTYPNLHHNNVSGNLDADDMHVIHDKAWAVIKDHFTAQKSEMQANYEFYLSKNKASSNIEEIVPASLDGAVDTVFIKKNTQVWGKYIDEANKVVIEPEKKENNICLLDLIAKECFIQGGKVYVLDQQELPEKEKPLNAILRY